MGLALTKSTISSNKVAGLQSKPTRCAKNETVPLFVNTSFVSFYMKQIKSYCTLREVLVVIGPKVVLGKGHTARLSAIVNEAKLSVWCYCSKLLKIGCQQFSG